MKSLAKNLVCGLMVLMFAAITFADTVDIVPEYRGTPNSVHVIYESPDIGLWEQTLFETGENSTYPLFFFVDNGYAAEEDMDDATLYYTAVPNFIDDEPVKYMRLQLTFNYEVSSEDIGIDVYPDYSPEPTGVVVGGSEPGVSDYHYFDIEIHPNPDFESVGIYLFKDGAAGGDSIGDPTRLSRIEIDTVSVPEPATISLLVLGSISFLKRKRFSRG